MKETKESPLEKANRLFPYGSHSDIMQNDPDLYWDLLFSGDLKKIKKSATRNGNGANGKLLKPPKLPKPEIQPRVRMALPQHASGVAERKKPIAPAPAKIESVPIQRPQLPTTPHPLMVRQPAPSVVRRTTGVPQKLDRGRVTYAQAELEARNRREFYERNGTQISQLESSMRDRRR
ncbi:MAG: hypothetical protein AAB573_04915 [Patescibacteria group bacterium]